MLRQDESPVPYQGYSCKVESLISVEQKRRPDSAMDSIKRAFRSLFKRGKKSKEDDQRQTPVQRQPPSKPTTANSAQAPAAPPKDVVQQKKSADPTGKLPPSHPLATAQQGQSKSTPPQDRAENAPIPAVSSGEQAKVSREEQGPPTLAPIKGTDSEPVSAISRESAPAPPPKTDGAADAVVAAPIEAAAAAPAGTVTSRP